MDYISTGGIRFGGCSSYRFAVNVLTAFEVGEMVYSKAKALKGFLRRHCIKKIIIDAAYEPIVYVDTFNAIFNEEELISYEDAVILATAANVRKAQDLENYALNC